MKVTIDGKIFETEEGKTILDVATENNIEIPTLCYHKALEPVGACRLCVVEIVDGDWSKLVTSCNYPVSDGLNIKTNSEKVRKSRKMTLELLLARCPEIAKIQDLAKEYGVIQPRFKLEEDNCILCGFSERSSMVNNNGERLVSSATSELLVYLLISEL